MESVVQNAESVIRLSLFFGLFVIFGVFEVLWPRKSLTSPKLSRWFGNLSIQIGNAVLLRLVFAIVGLTAVGFSAFIEANQFGLLHQINLPQVLGLLLGFLILDGAVYGQHLVLHKVPVLWRLHRMHHADTDIDVTTGLRFHPLEILVSMAFKFAVILMFGVNPFTVLIFEIVLNATSMFNHANMALPPSLDRVLRLFVVTPDMHRVHHSVHTAEYNHNFGFNLPWWDRMFGTYQDQPVDGHDAMTIGLPTYRGPEWRSPWRLLRIPFDNDTPRHAPDQGQGQGHLT
ncbi:MAG: sterol desaturase family protein [Alphaproteobacteria bacterium]|nr:MAG: sterol desaturase family protein [Alphaproteobacteria bacterium]